MHPSHLGGSWLEGTAPWRVYAFSRKENEGQVSDHCLLSALQGDHVWLNPLSANKSSVAIGCIVKETKPGKILLEDDEGKVSVTKLSRSSGPTLTSPAVQGPEPLSSSGAALQH